MDTIGMASAAAISVAQNFFPSGCHRMWPDFTNYRSRISDVRRVLQSPTSPSPFSPTILLCGRFWNLKPHVTAIHRSILPATQDKKHFAVVVEKPIQRDCIFRDEPIDQLYNGTKNGSPERYPLLIAQRESSRTPAPPKRKNFRTNDMASPYFSIQNHQGPLHIKVSRL